MERTSRNRNPFVTFLAVVVAALTTLILAAPYAGEFSTSAPAHGAPSVAPCVAVDAPAAAPAAETARPAAVHGWATEEKLGGR